ADFKIEDVEVKKEIEEDDSSNVISIPLPTLTDFKMEDVEVKEEEEELVEEKVPEDTSYAVLKPRHPGPKSKVEELAKEAGLPISAKELGSLDRLKSKQFIDSLPEAQRAVARDIRRRVLTNLAAVRHYKKKRKKTDCRNTLRGLIFAAVNEEVVPDQPPSPIRDIPVVGPPIKCSCCNFLHVSGAEMVRHFREHHPSEPAASVLYLSIRGQLTCGWNHDSAK
ncbi:hypothetical protein PFISCL1PPCAC_4377, partial [Pristionchus fissidentatus]